MHRTAPVARLAALAVATLALGGCGREPAPPAAGSGADAAAQLATVEVGAATAPAELRVDGVVEAVRQATLSAQTAGRVAEVAVDVNDAVQQGQLLMRLRATEQVAGLSQAQAALAAAAARETQARAQYERLHDMYQRKVVARATYDEALAARDAATANLAAARAAVESAREGVAYTELRAPFDGVVTARPVQVGEAVAPGAPLLLLSGLGELRVVAEIPQAVADLVRAEPRARVYVGDRVLESTSVVLFPAADPASGSFRARINLAQATAGLAPGTYAKVGFASGQAARTTLPRGAIVERSELRAVYVVAPDGRVALRQVRLGREVGDQVEVIAGLARGERVATDPARAGLLARHGAAAAHD
jgi:RND family efflux transporter MFP subunit